MNRFSFLRFYILTGHRFRDAPSADGRRYRPPETFLERFARVHMLAENGSRADRHDHIDVHLLRVRPQHVDGAPRLRFRDYGDLALRCILRGRASQLKAHSTHQNSLLIPRNLNQDEFQIFHCTCPKSMSFHARAIRQPMHRLEGELFPPSLNLTLNTLTPREGI